MKDTILEILNRITSCNEGCDYNIKCAYSDGQDKTFLVITFFQRNRSSIIGKITFCEQSSQVCQYFYKQKRFSYAKDIVNLLLDIYNNELNCKLAAVK